MTGRTRSGLWRCALASFVAAAFAALAVGGPADAAAQETLAASCQAAENTFNGTTGDKLFAQPFTSEVTGDLTSAELRLRNFSGTGDWIIQIRATQPSASFTGESEPTATVLASATLPDASIPDGTDSTQTVPFTDPAAVMAGQSYALSVTRPDATDSNSLAVSSHTPGTECAERTYSSDNGGTTWSSQSLDMIFRVFVTSPATTPPVTTPTTPVAPVPSVTRAKKCKRKHKRSAKSAKKKCKKKKKRVR